MVKTVLKVILFLMVLKKGYRHRYKIMNVLLQHPLLRQFVVSRARDIRNSMPIGLITRVYL